MVMHHSVVNRCVAPRRVCLSSEVLKGRLILLKTTDTMKIMHIVHSYPPVSFGGTEIYTQSLIDEQARNNQLFVIYSAPPEIIKGRGDRIFEEEKNIRTYAFSRKEAQTFEETYYDPSRNHVFAGMLKKYSPDIVHIQHLLFHSTSFIDVVMMASIPLIMTLHDYWYLCPQFYLSKTDGTLCDGPGDGRVCLTCDCADGSSYLGRKKTTEKNRTIITGLKTAMRIFPPRLQRVLKNAYIGTKRAIRRNSGGFAETKRRLEKTVAALNKAGCIISPSTVLADRYSKAGVRNIRVLPHGISSPMSGLVQTAEKYATIKKRNITFGYIGGIAPHKGVHVVIDAFNRLSSQGSSLLIFGKNGTHPDYDKQLAAMVSHPNIRLMGFVDHTALFETMSAIDVIIIPSICAENYPLTANEAFMMKIPVIASNVGGLNLLIQNGVNGFLFEKGDSDQLMAIIEKIIRTPEILADLSDGILPIKTMQEHSRELDALYRKVIAGSGR
jgi:glycosyltransferase involved in cell wall biosynthesis